MTIKEMQDKFKTRQMENAYHKTVTPEQEREALAWAHQVVGNLSIQCAEHTHAIDTIMELINDQREVLYMFSQITKNNLLPPAKIDNDFKIPRWKTEGLVPITSIKGSVGCTNQNKTQWELLYKYSVFLLHLPEPLPYIIKLSNEITKASLIFQLLPISFDHKNIPPLRLFMDPQNQMKYSDEDFRGIDTINILQQGQRIDLHTKADQEEQHFRFMHIGLLQIDEHPGYNVWILVAQKNFQKPKGNNPSEDFLARPTTAEF